MEQEQIMLPRPPLPFHLTHIRIHMDTYDTNETNKVSDEEPPSTSVVQWVKTNEPDTKTYGSIVIQPINDPLHFQWKANVKDLELNRSKLIQDWDLLFWRLEFVFDCMHANQTISLGETPKFYIHPDATTENVWDPFATFELKIPGSAFLQSFAINGNRKNNHFMTVCQSATNISLLRLTLVATTVKQTANDHHSTDDGDKYNAVIKKDSHGYHYANDEKDRKELVLDNENIVVNIVKVNNGTLMRYIYSPFQ